MTVYGTTYQNLAPGTTLTGSSSGGNSGFSAATSNLIATAVDGIICAQASNPGTALALVRRTASTELATKAKWIVPFIGRVPAADWQVLRLNWGTAIGTDSGLAVHVTINSAGKMKVTTQGSGSAVVRLNGGQNSTIVAGTKYQLECYATTDGTATGGTLHIVLYQYGTSTVVGDFSYSISGIDLGTGGFTNAIGLKNSNDSNTGTETLLPGAVLKTQSDALDVAEPYGSSAPTVSAGAAQNVAPGASVALAASVSGGTAPFTYAWSFDFPASGAPALTGGATANASFTAGASKGLLYTAKVTVTDANNQVATSTVEVRTQLDAAGTEMRPLASGTPVLVGAWVPVGGTGNTVLADESDSTYYETPVVTSTEVTMRSRYQPSVNRSDGTVSVRLAKSDSGSLTFTIRLFIGANSTTVIESWTVSPTTTPTDYAHPLTSATISAITAAADGWNQVRVEIAATS